jgi:hypothetical protein
MPTIPNNLNLVSPDPKFPKSLPITTDQAVNQGDMVWFDKVNGTVKPLTNPNQVAIGAAGGFCGISNDTTPINVYGTENLAAVGITRKGVVSLKTTPGEFYSEFQEVTVGADSQTITLVGVTEANRIGFVVTDPPLKPNPAAGSTPVGETLKGAEGVSARVWLEPKFPSKTV